MRTFEEYIGACDEAVGLRDILKGAAVGGAFMVPVAGIPLAVYLARRLYGDRASPEQIKLVLDRLKNRLLKRQLS